MLRRQHSCLLEVLHAGHNPTTAVRVGQYRRLVVVVEHIRLVVDKDCVLAVRPGRNLGEDNLEVVVVHMVADEVEGRSLRDLRDMEVGHMEAAARMEVAAGSNLVRREDMPWMLLFVVCKPAEWRV
jgi:hypothetical protein